MENKKLNLNNNIKAALLGKIKDFVQDELDEDIGDLKANIIFDFIESEFGKAFYNKGVNDTRKFIIQRLEDMEIDMDQILL